MLIPEDPPIQPSSSGVECSVSTVKLINVKRLDDKPDMFYNLQLENPSPKEIKETHPEVQETNEPLQANNNRSFLLIRTALNMNYIVIIYCIMLFPRTITSIIYCNCDHQNGECEVPLLVYKAMHPIYFLLVVSGSLTFFYKIKRVD